MVTKNVGDWKKWAFLEGVTRTLSRTLQKVVGSVSNNWENTLLASGIIGLVQVLSAVIITRKMKEKLLCNPAGIIGCLMFGFFALVSTVLGFVTFLYEGDITISTFIIALSIIPGMIIDIIFFKHKSSRREWIGIFVAVISGWAVLDFPNLAKMFEMPIWVGLSFITMILVAINQGITQSIKDVSPMFKNFWGGMVALILSPIVMIVIGKGGFLLSFPGNKILWFTSAMIGIIVIAIWSFNLLSFKGGASIALKKLVVSSTYFISTTILGSIVFNEAMTAGKITAIPLFIISYFFMSKEAYDFVRAKWIPKWIKWIRWISK